MSQIYRKEKKARLLKVKQMNRLSRSLLAVVGTCLLTFLMVASCNRDNKSVHKTDFFGVDLDEYGNQVEKFHDLLLAGKVRNNGKVLTEWTDHIGTDYWISEGKMTSVGVDHGDVDKVSVIRDSLNLSYSERFTPENHIKLKQWIQTDSDEHYFEYIDFYKYGLYSIGVHYRIYSPTCDETNITFADVRVGLGLRSE